MHFLGEREVPVEGRQSLTAEEIKKIPVAALVATRRLTNQIELLEALVSILNYQSLTEYDGEEKEPRLTQKTWHHPFRANGKQPTEEGQSPRPLL